MTAAVFIRCRRCNELYRVVAGGSRTSRAGGAGAPTGHPPRRIQFLRRHDGHPLEALAQVAEPELLTSQPQRSAARVLWEVTNGQERLLIEGRSTAKRANRLEYRVVTAERMRRDHLDSGRREEA